MILRERIDIPADKTFDICIVGAGASGLTIASDFAGGRVSVCVLESGGADAIPTASDLSAGESTGLTYAELDTCRLRGLGGSTQALGWGGLCKPLDEQDFAVRPWVRHSGWPFGREHLLPYYRRAQKTLGIADVEALGQRQPLFPGRSDIISVDHLELCRHNRPGKRLRHALENADNISILLHSTLLYLSFDEEKRTVGSAVVKNGADETIHIRARTFVLAAGGIENARLLLLSGGPGSDDRTTGRFFMDHPRFSIGTLVPANGSVLRTLNALDRIRIARGQRIRDALSYTRQRPYLVNGLTLPAELQQREELLNYRAWLEPCFIGQDTAKLQAMKEKLLAYREQRLHGVEAKSAVRAAGKEGLVSWTWLMHLVRPSSLLRSFRLLHIVEPEPEPESRVMLSNKKDRFGLPMVNLRWQLSAKTVDSVMRTITILGSELTKTGLGKLIVKPEELTGLEKPMWTWHHMGTTRMHVDPGQGVVDTQCKVHGTDNLFIAGSSVFPTAGNDTPTLTVVALAHRLADHLLQVVGG
ncbi:hypothetical protein ASD02_29585 [Ensifer sp. Root1252]|jgi:choline dehydrogenase-like flavoprotein|uniref:GMC oxidoreductase n=1 Tax=Ensifer TaxID=106591 RepID=UPI00042F3EBB|nr:MULTISPECIES: GMC family oxidoreductase [Ensifer]AHK45141.1 FAD dependent oxidoreductase [Ensifer adhaerens OV14]KQW56006.1 hypothetical protein ASD02_29585 [Ensifer sp. Root1252]KQW83414.1 hypothetical protein ASD03_22295 [Ensifer sp. Root127]KRC77484.1 hypothetical protein ASE32_29350 [Ensifer sp. Root231]KRC96315.1 hypothetical protein ASE47_32280 [Ensifer sp. Root258]OMQ43987.1 hypothetical protein BKP54_14625 [Ensifer sp. 1H6]PSS61883.1 GMC family oxidoreductase [Ensifer sp. NM-2]